MVPLSKEDAINNLAPSYHYTFRRLFDTHIQPDEVIYLAANASVISERTHDDQKERVSHACFVVITNCRWFSAGMSWMNSGGVVYRKAGEHPAAIPLLDKFFKHKWVFPPSELPRPGSLLYLWTKQPLHERIGEFIYIQSLRDLPDVRSKDYFSITHKGQEIKLIEIGYNETWWTFEEEDGNLAYELLRISAQSNGDIPNDRNLDSSMSDPVKRMQQLKELLDLGLLSKEEHEAKRQEIMRDL